MDIIRIILAIILPPLGVLMQLGIANKHFLDQHHPDLFRLPAGDHPRRVGHHQVLTRSGRPGLGHDPAPGDPGPGRPGPGPAWRVCIP